MKAPPYDLMQSADVSKSNRYVDKTHRHNCPLDPAYTFHGEQIQDNPRYSKPKGLPKYIADNHLLQTRDIAGAFPGWTQSTLERREFKNTNFVQDIDGAQADTIKHSMVTKRCTNPQNKVYVGLDGDLLVAPVVSLLPPEIIKRPTLRDTGRGEGGDGSSQSARRHVETVDVTNKDALGQQMMKSARSSSKPSSPRRTSVLGTELAEREASPRPKGMTTIDSAAYSNSKPPVANSNATRPPARAPSDNNSSNTRNAWSTPRSARGAGPESHTYKQENYLGNTNTMNLYQDSDAIAFADKFVKSEMLIMPTRQPQQQQGNNGGISSRPPTGGSGHGNSSARGGGYGSARVPQLDLNNMGTGSLSARQGQASGRAGAASGRVGSARSARPTKEEAQLNVDIMSVRALE